MTVSNMKYKRAAHKLFNVLDSWWMLFPFAIAGLIIRDVIGAVIGVGVGYAISCLIEMLWPFEASELQWNDIKLAIHNYSECFQPGAGGIKFICKDRIFVFEKRKVFRYTEDTEFVVWYKTRKWEDLFDEKDDTSFTELCGKAPIRDVDLDTNKTFLIPQQEKTEDVLEICLKLIKHFIAKTSGIVEDVTARERLIVWVDPQYQQVSPVPIVSFNFKGKKDGRPVLYVVNRKGYWILHENGELEPFADFDAWYNTPSKKKSVRGGHSESADKTGRR